MEVEKDIRAGQRLGDCLIWGIQFLMENEKIRRDIRNAKAYERKPEPNADSLPDAIPIHIVALLSHRSHNYGLLLFRRGRKDNRKHDRKEITNSSIVPLDSHFG